VIEAEAEPATTPVIDRFLITRSVGSVPLGLFYDDQFSNNLAPQGFPAVETDALQIAARAGW
jgi:hypothetical protein